MIEIYSGKLKNKAVPCPIDRHKCIDVWIQIIDPNVFQLAIPKININVSVSDET